MVEAKRAFLLVFAASGIYASYLTQGIVQENLSTKRYGPLSERFPHLSALAGVQAVVCFLWAGLLMMFSKDDATKKLPPFTAFWMAGLTNSIGPACGIQALKNISYPAQVLAKSCKMIPVMLMGTLLYGKRYSMFEYLCVSLIAGGISLFASETSSKVRSKLASPNAPLGYALCLVNLVFDGYTNAAQDEISRKYKDNSAIHMMCWMNFWCGLYYCGYLFGATSQGPELLAFCQQHPDAARDLALFCLCGAFGQLFIFFTIRTFGSLVNTIVCTTRKFFNILISVVWNGNALFPLQWVGVALVFSGLMASSISKGMRTKTGKHH